MRVEDAMLPSWKDIVTKLSTDNKLFAYDRRSMETALAHMRERGKTTAADDRAVMVAIGHHLGDAGLRVEGTGGSM